MYSPEVCSLHQGGTWEAVAIRVAVLCKTDILGHSFDHDGGSHYHLVPQDSCSLTDIVVPLWERTEQLERGGPPAPWTTTPSAVSVILRRGTAAQTSRRSTAFMHPTGSARPRTEP